MKKLLVYLIVLLSIVAMLGCSAENRNVDVRQETRQDILELIDLFGDPQYEDLEFYEGGNLYGTADFILAERGSGINLMLIEEGIVVMLEIVMDSSSSLNVAVWNVMITYQDNNNEIFVYLDYYHEGEWPLHEDFDVELMPITFSDLVENVGYLTIGDIQTILLELGYNVN